MVYVQKSVLENQTYKNISISEIKIHNQEDPIQM